MSLSQTLLDLIEERGDSSAPDLLPLVEGYTVKQITQSLNYLRGEGKLRGVQRGGGHGKPAVFGRLEPTQPKVRPVASVFELGDRARRPE